jgi:DNA-binding MarR family transcriptional regulator
MAKLLRRTRAARDQISLDVLRQFRLVYGAMHRHFRETERRCGLSGAQAWMLREVSLQPGIGVGALAACLSIHQSTVSQLVNKLEQRGYLVRDAHPRDRRRTGLRVTSAGRSLARRLPRPAQGVLPHALAKLPRRSIGRLRAELVRLVSQLQARRSDSREHLADL